MRIMAGDTTQLSPTGAIALAQVHLIDLADITIFVVDSRGGHEDGANQVQGQPRSKIENLPASTQYAILPQQVALFADRLPQKGSQTTGVNYSVVPIINGFTVLAALHVKLSRPVTSFAADRVTFEDRRAVSIFRILHRLGLVAMAHQTIGADRPAR